MVNLSPRREQSHNQKDERTSLRVRTGRGPPAVDPYIYSIAVGILKEGRVSEDEEFHQYTLWKKRTMQNIKTPLAGEDPTFTSRFETSQPDDPPLLNSTS